MRFFGRALGALLLTSTLAIAAPQEDGKGHGGGNGQGKGPGTGDGAGEGSGHGKHHGEHGDAGVAIKRTPEQEAFRKDLLDKKHKLVADIVHANGKRATKAEHNTVRRYWRHVTRLLRIRELAQDAKDDATVKKVDALLERAEANFTVKLKKQSEEAAAGTAAPAVGGDK